MSICRSDCHQRIIIEGSLWCKPPGASLVGNTALPVEINQMLYDFSGPDGVIEWTVSVCWVILLFSVLCSFGLGVFDSMDEKVNTVSFSCVSRGCIYKKTLVLSRKVNIK